MTAPAPVGYDHGQDLLTRLGITPHRVDLPLDHIDRHASLANQARLEPLDPETVDRYTQALRDGAVFPPVIARDLDPGSTHPLVLLAGNHRHEAHLAAGRPTIDAWIITCSDAEAARIAYEDNARHGLPPTRTERLHHALHLVNTGLPQQEAARALGVTPAGLSEAVTVQRASVIAADHALPAFDTLPHSTRYQLATIHPDPHVFAAATDLALTHQLTAAEVKRLAEQVTTAPTVHQALVTIGAASEDLAADRATRGVDRKRGGTPAHQQLRRRLQDVRFLAPTAVAASIPDPHTRLEVRQEILDTAKQLQAFLKAIG